MHFQCMSDSRSAQGQSTQPRARAAVTTSNPEALIAVFTSVNPFRLRVKEQQRSSWTVSGVEVNGDVLEMGVVGHRRKNVQRSRAEGAGSKMNTHRPSGTVRFLAMNITRVPARPNSAGTQASSSLMIPGAREPNTLTSRQPGAMGGPASGSSLGGADNPLMDAQTLDERRREGGGLRKRRRAA